MNNSPLLLHPTRLLSSARRIWLLAAFPLAFGLVGCQGPQLSQPAPGIRPREGAVVSLAEYVVNPPDILKIEMEAIPSNEQVIDIGDTLAINVTNTLPDYPIQNTYPVDSQGEVDLGYYGRVRVGGLTVEAAQKAIEEFLGKEELVDPEVRLA